MHPLKGRKQSPEHIAARAKALRGRPGNVGAGRPANTPEVLWSKVEKRGGEECWPWKGTVTEKGYGRTEIKNKNYYAHRVIFDLVNPGIIQLRDNGSKEQCVRHTCDNPICCNPKHLLLGNHQQNMDDKVERGRSKIWSSSIESPRAKLTAEDVFWIRIQKKYGATLNALSLLYDVSRSTISGCLYGRHYQDV